MPPNALSTTSLSGNVLIYTHKDVVRADIERRYPVCRDVLINDKLRIFDAVKRAWRERVTTTEFARQGFGAPPPEDASISPIFSRVIDRSRARPRSLPNLR